MKKYPFEKQEEAKDCGVSCLSMIIRYHKGYFPKEDLREMTKTNRDGTTAYHLVETLKEIGFDSYGVKCKFEDFEIETLIFPCIASVIINKSYKHFIVIYEINYQKKYLIIGDPADKLKKVKFEDFDCIYNDVLIFSKPNKTIPIINDQGYNFLKIILNKYKKLIIKLVLLSIIITILAIFLSFYFGLMIKGIDLNSSNYLLIFFIIFLSMNTFKIIINHLRNRILININTNIDYDLTSNVFQKIIMLPYRYYRNRTTGDIISRMNDLSVVRDIIGRASLSLFLDLPLAFLTIVILFVINYKLCFVLIIMVLLYLLMVLAFRKIYKIKVKKVQISRANSTSYMVESISGFETLKGIHIETIVNNKFRVKYFNLIKHLKSLYHNYYLQKTLEDFISDYGIMIIIYIGCIFITNHSFTLMHLIIFNALVSFFLEPFKNFLNLDSSFNEAKGAIKRIKEIMNKNDQDGLIMGNFKGSIQFNNLTYSFNDRDNILNDINLIINYSEKVMIIGESGSGKSTLLKLLMKYYKVAKNKLLIDNVDINNISLKSINKGIAYINQNEMLFNDTIYNNINLYNNDSMFLEVVKLCHIDEIIPSDLGYNTIIEENGFNISGGEKQRIVLARTLMTKFEILIIDEGLNQVDVNMERKILKGIFKMFSDKTIIVISHRMDNVDLFERLIEINKGTIIKDIKKNFLVKKLSNELNN